jgi:hypothetical protein
MSFKRTCLIVILASAISASLCAAPISGKHDGAEGAALGLFLGQPTGISFRYGLGHEQSLEAKAAWNLANAGSDPSISLQANWLLEFPGILVIQKEDFPLYVGAGVQADVGQATRLGFRIPAGLAYRFNKAPIELCLEIGLGMELFPSTSFLSSGGLGVRYRF